MQAKLVSRNEYSSKYNCHWGEKLTVEKLQNDASKFNPKQMLILLSVKCDKNGHKWEDQKGSADSHGNSK